MDDPAKEAPPIVAHRPVGLTGLNPKRSSTMSPITRASGVVEQSRSKPRPAVADTGKKPRPARSAFTQATEGESLTDVAVRVYGTSDAAKTLWMANRDLIERPETVLVAGTLLRTP